MWKRTLGLILAMIMVCCAHRMIGATDDEQMWWDMAREELKEYGLRTRDSGNTVFIPYRGYVSCNGRDANGCYSPSSKTIAYNIETPQVVMHEAQHAILHQMGYLRAVYHCIPEHHSEPKCAGWPWIWGGK